MREKKEILNAKNMQPLISDLCVPFAVFFSKRHLSLNLDNSFGNKGYRVCKKENKVQY